LHSFGEDLHIDRFAERLGERMVVVIEVIQEQGEAIGRGSVGISEPSADPFGVRSDRISCALVPAAKAHEAGRREARSR
jgi:hypothetical protein